MKLLILIGAPGSGKSTFAKYLLRTEENWVRVCRDDFRLLQFSSSNLDPEKETLISKMIDACIDTALKNKQHIVVDATHTKRDFIEHFIHKFKEKADISFKLFDVAVAELKERCAKRYTATGKFIPERVIEKYVAELEHLKKEFDFSDRPKTLRKEVVVYRTQPEGLPKAIISDLDGTLALLNGRNPYDASLAHEDPVNHPVASILKNYQALGYKILLVSGREETYRPQTEVFLRQHGIPYHALWMRRRNDYRKDAVIKKELFQGHIEGCYNVEFVLEDRDQVVELWRKQLHLPCFQVAYGDF